MSLFCDADADLNFAQTEWGDSGVYVCAVISSQDLSGNTEDYTELIVLGKLGANDTCHAHSLAHLFLFVFLQPAVAYTFTCTRLTATKKCQTAQTSEKG